MKHFRISKGLTLLELLIVLGIVAIIFTLASPAFVQMVQTARQKSALGELISLINLARNTAIQEQVTVTLCPLFNNQICASDWSKPLVAFRDPGRTKTASTQSQILRILQLNDSGQLTGKTGIRNYFRFRPSGFAEEAIGNIVWCPKDGDIRHASQIRINMGGRPFISKDSDHDGIAEDAYGQPLQCSSS